MNIRRYAILIVVFLSIDQRQVHSQAPQTPCMPLPVADSNFRYLHDTAWWVPVQRYAFTKDWMKRAALDEVVFAKTYPEATLLVSYQDFNLFGPSPHTRNCHDYAWAPFMTDDFENTVAGSQREAWWMCDPSPNWLGPGTPPLKVVATSSAYIGWDDDVHTQIDITNSGSIMEYLFDTTQLDNLEDTYYDELAYFIGLPTCPIDDIHSGIVPLHSAVLVAWFTPPTVDPKYVAGIFESKWGLGGIWQHRYGCGYLPDVQYVSAFHLQVFAPSGVDWPYQSPPYIISYSPWGMFNP